MFSRTALLWISCAVLLIALPPVTLALGQPFYVDLVRRIMIFALAAVSLNLILGFYGLASGWLHFGVAVAASALVALVIGAVSIRASGVYFIMITLAFTQMLYYLGLSLAVFGGDDGMRLRSRSRFPLIDLGDSLQFYYLVLALLAAALYLIHRIVNSRFGMVLRAAKSNEARSCAIGFSPYAYRLVAFTIAGAMGGLAGALLANHTNYLTPDFMHWTRSGEIMFMVILGGMGTAAGPVAGAFALLLLEDVLAGWTEHWQVILGPLLVLSVIFFKRGLAGVFFKPDA